MAERFVDAPTLQESIFFSNDFLINNNGGGHIQGVQYFESGGAGYYFLTGSSDTISYYVIADPQSRKVITVDTFFESPLRHPGGFQIVDNLLAVGIEDNRRKDRSKVCLYELIGPANNQLKLLKAIERTGPEKRYTAGCVALTEVGNHLLIGVGNWDTKNIEFYLLPNDALYNEEVDFVEVFSFDSQTADRSNWIDTTWNAYQNINFITEGSALYLVGTAKKDTTDYEIIDLYRVHAHPKNVFDLQKVAHHTYINADTATTFKWGGGVHLSTSGNLSFFSTNRNIRDTLIINKRIAPNLTQ